MALNTNHHQRQNESASWSRRHQRSSMFLTISWSTACLSRAYNLHHLSRHFSIEGSCTMKLISSTVSSKNRKRSSMFIDRANGLLTYFAFASSSAWVIASARFAWIRFQSSTARNELTKNGMVSRMGNTNFCMTGMVVDQAA